MSPLSEELANYEESGSFIHLEHFLFRVCVFIRGKETKYFFDEQTST